MPIALTTPFNPGDVDPGKSYAYLYVTGMRWLLSGSIVITCCYGNTVDGKFVPGRVPPFEVEISDRPRSDPPGYSYSLMVSAMPQPGETTYQGVGRALYQYLLDSNAAAGVIE